MQLSLERKIFLGFTGAVGLLLFSGGAAWLSATRTTETFRQVDHTHRVLYQLEAVLTDLLNMQSSTRGFLITGEERFLEAYLHGRDRIDNNLSQLANLIADNPAQQTRGALLAAGAARVTGIMRDRIAIRRTSGYEAAVQAEALSGGKAAMDSVRQAVAAMEREERILLEERSTEARHEAGRTFLVTAGGGSLAVLLIGAAALLVRRDLRQRLTAEAERDRFFTLSLDLLCIASGDGYFKRVNPAFTQTLGWSTGEMLARPFLDFVHPDDHAATLREVERQVTAGEPVLHFENRYRHKDGSWRVLSWRSIPHGGLMFATARDVTEQLLAEEEIRHLNADLRQRAAQLEAVNAELEAFSYSVSHDLRAPLRHIDGFASLLEKNATARLDDKDRRYLATISGAARQMGVLIDDLLAFARVGRSAIQPVPVDHAALVAEIIRTGLVAAPQVEWRIAPLPSLPGDPALLRQVWFNLLDNAVKYSRPAATPVVEITARTDGPEIIFSVRDNGVGFDPRYTGKLFQVFSRLHSAGEFEGTGIGLALVRRIVARHGGRTWAEGEPGRGACISFAFPNQPFAANAA